jgi:hypothetical protein
VSSKAYDFFKQQAAKQNFALHHLREQGAYQIDWETLRQKP